MPAPLSDDDRADIRRALRENMPHYNPDPEPASGDRPLGVARGLLWALALYLAAAAVTVIGYWVVTCVLN